MVKKTMLVVYYSRTGNTKKVAERISNQINADVDEIVDLKDRKRKIIGWIISGRDAMNKSLTEIKFKKKPEDYDLVIIGTPNWVSTMAPAIRTYLTQNKLKNVAFFCTYGGNEGHVFEDMKNLTQKPLASLGLHDEEIDSKDSLKKIKDFSKKFLIN